MLLSISRIIDQRGRGQRGFFQPRSKAGRGEASSRVVPSGGKRLLHRGWHDSRISETAFGLSSIKEKLRHTEKLAKKTLFKTLVKEGRD